MSDLPPDLPRLRTWSIGSPSASYGSRSTSASPSSGSASGGSGPVPDRIIETGIGQRREPLHVHVGGCHMAGQRQRPIDRVQALRALTDGVKEVSPAADPTPHCRFWTDRTPRPSRQAAAGPSCVPPRVRPFWAPSRLFSGRFHVIVRPGRSPGRAVTFMRRPARTTHQDKLRGTAYGATAKVPTWNRTGTFRLRPHHQTTPEPPINHEPPTEGVCCRKLLLLPPRRVRQGGARVLSSRRVVRRGRHRRRVPGWQHWWRVRRVVRRGVRSGWLHTGR
jgi:hypothetical protein